MLERWNKKHHYAILIAMKKPSITPPLETVTIKIADAANKAQYPFSLPIIQNLKLINFPTQVTFFVGENGSGKSTILEAMAWNAGFGPEGGSKNIHFKTAQEENYTGAQLLADRMTLSWRAKPKNGYFFRAESFFNVANYLEQVAKTAGGPEITYAPYGGKSLHEQSHGESFLAFFKHRLGTNGFFIFDEPEAALSPQRQLSLLCIIHEMCKNPDAQFIIATHSPILLAYPGATIYSCDNDNLTNIAYKDTQHYRITKRFLDDPERYLHHLFEE